MKNSLLILPFLLLITPTLANEVQDDGWASLRIYVTNNYIIPDGIKISISQNHNHSDSIEMKEIEKGTFFAKLSPGSYRINISGADWNDITYTIIGLKPNEVVELTFGLIPDQGCLEGVIGGAINGRLLGPQGDPLEDLDIGILTFQRLLGIGCREMTHLFDDYYIDDLGSGYFRIWLPWPEKWNKRSQFYLEASAPGFAVQKICNFTLRSGDIIDLGEVKLLRRESSISGTVINEETGLPLGREVWINAKCDDMYGEGFDITTNGFYKINNLPPGIYSIQFDTYGKKPKFHYETDIWLEPCEHKALNPIILQKKQDDSLVEWTKLSNALFLPFSVLFISPDGILMLPIYLNTCGYEWLGIVYISHYTIEKLLMYIF